MAFSEDGYELVTNAVNGDLLEYLNTIIDLHEYVETNMRASEKKQFPHCDPQIGSCFAWYGSYHSEALLVYLKAKIEKVVNLNLIPTYSYYRTYYYNSHLKPHKDRESCQYSATLCLHKDLSHWPIYFERPDKSIVSYDLNAGDMVIYKGMDLLHWRDPFRGQKQKQMFLHYIDANGPYANEWIFDGRPSLALGGEYATIGQIKQPAGMSLPE